MADEKSSFEVLVEEETDGNELVDRVSDSSILTLITTHDEPHHNAVTAPQQIYPPDICLGVPMFQGKCLIGIIFLMSCALNFGLWLFYEKMLHDYGDKPKTSSDTDLLLQNIQLALNNLIKSCWLSTVLAIVLLLIIISKVFDSLVSAYHVNPNRAPETDPSQSHGLLR